MTLLPGYGGLADVFHELSVYQEIVKASLCGACFALKNQVGFLQFGCHR